LVTKEQFQSLKEYIVHQPILIAEVLSDSTRKYNSTEKFIQYQKISSLRYYLLVEPEKHVVIFYEKDDNGEWAGRTFTEMDEVISLPVLESQLLLADINS
jgi:Uma2 family endonuclease